MGDNLSFWTRDDHLNLGGKPWPENNSFCPSLHLYMIFCAIWMSFIIVIWWDDESQTTGRSAEDKECSADEAAKDFGGGNSEVAFPAMKMSSEIWWWEKTLNFRVFFGCCWKTCAFFSFIKNMWKNPSTFFSPFFFLSLNEVVGKTCHTPRKKEVPTFRWILGVIFGGGSRTSFLPPHFWLTFSGDGMMKNPLAFCLR